MLRWSEVKERVRIQMQTDPQRGTLASQAIARVEEGLTYLTGVGFSFELAPRGTYSQLASGMAEALELSRTLSIAEGQEIVAPKASDQPDLFEAK